MFRQIIIVLFVIGTASSAMGQSGKDGVEFKWAATRRMQVSNDRFVHVISSYNEYATDPGSVKDQEWGTMFQTLILPSGKGIKGCNDPFNPHRQSLGGYVQKIIRVRENPWIAFLVTRTRIYRIHDDRLEEVAQLKVPHEFWFTASSGTLLPVYSKWDTRDSSLDRRLHAMTYYDEGEWKQAQYDGPQKGHIQQYRDFHVAWGRSDGSSVAVNGKLLILEPNLESDFRRILFVNGQFFDLPPEKITIRGNTVTVTTPPFSITVKK